MKKAILVAGGAGYIGAHVCKALAAAGYLPVTLDNFATGRRDFVRYGPLVESSVADREAVRKAVREYNIKAVVDLAGSIEVAESVRDPLKYYYNNVAVKFPFLETLRECDVGAFVFSSTAAVYGEPESIPIPETHPLLPKNPYGWSKLVFEQILRDFHNAGGPRWMALRYFNAAGASPDGDIGECHEPESHLIPRACFAALGMTPSLDVYGNDYPTSDGTAVRDYVHVTDLASAHVTAVELLLQGAPPVIYNLGNGAGMSVGEIIRSFKELGIEVPHRFMPRRPGDPAKLVADVTAARKDLGWAPRYGNIKTIIRSAYGWHKKHHKAEISTLLLSAE
jgi:UDP-glucose-4-epimerase GalE